MKHLGIILLMLITVLTSCNGNKEKETLSVTEDTVFAFGNFTLDKALSAGNTFGNGSRIVINDNSGRHEFRFREKYDFGSFNGTDITLKDGSRSIRKFDVYELVSFSGSLAPAEDVRGIALEKADGSVLTFLVFKDCAFNARRGEIACEKGRTLNIDTNRPEMFSYALAATHRFSQTRLFVLPLYSPENEPSDDRITLSEPLEPKECLSPSRDSVMLFPCLGEQPEITCRDMNDGRSLITVKNAADNGEDITFYVSGRFNHTAEAAELYNTELYVKEDWSKVNNVRGTALCLDNGRILNIFQFAQKPETLKSYRIAAKPVYIPEPTAQSKVLLKNGGKTLLYRISGVIQGNK